MSRRPWFVPRAVKGPRKGPPDQSAHTASRPAAHSIAWRGTLLAAFENARRSTAALGLTSASRETGRAAPVLQSASRETSRKHFGVHDASGASRTASSEATSASSGCSSGARAPSWAEISLASAAPRRTRASLEVFRERPPVPRDALAEASGSRSSGSGAGVVNAEARVTRSGAVSLECVPLDARGCATATRGAASIEARDALVVLWEALVVVRQALVVVREALVATREAPATPREALGTLRADAATSSDDLFALRSAFALLRSPATGGRASPPVTAPRPSRARSARSLWSPAPSAPWADPVATRAALVTRCEAHVASRAPLAVRGDAPSVTGASLVKRREDEPQEDAASRRAATTRARTPARRAPTGPRPALSRAAPSRAPPPCARRAPAAPRSSGSRCLPPGAPKPRTAGP